MEKIKTFIRNLKLMINHDLVDASYVHSVQMNAEYTNDKVNALKGQVASMQNLHVDLHHKSPSMFIAVGRFRGKDYVKAFALKQETFQEFVELMKDQKYLLGG